ncbi:MAG: S-methyl-5-thioribose-1-phosphate isomerase [Halofilum sp. (in: g-proteobacteria)]
MSATASTDNVRALHWQGDRLALLDQRLLPGEQRWCECRSAGEVAAAITDMVVRGAPAIGIAAAYGLVLAARAGEDLDGASGRLGAARPTAVNLHWALARMGRVAAESSAEPVDERLERVAVAIHAEDLAANHRIGALGAAELGAPAAVLTHCNTGALATGGFGTALGVIRAGWAAGHITEVFADETRPWLQGARLTAWELQQENIPARVLCDSAAASLMASGRVRWVIVGADRVAANGDVANKIGTYGLAVLARHHGVGFMVAAPTSTIDPAVPDGSAIPIEERPPGEVLAWAGQRSAPVGADAWNPVFDVTPAELVDALVTERGVLHRPDRGAIAALLADGSPGVVDSAALAP